MVFVEHHTHFNVYVSQRSQIQFEDEDHAVYMSFRSILGLGSNYLNEFSLSNNYMSSLRTTTCDALIVPSVSYLKSYAIHRLNI